MPHERDAAMNTKKFHVAMPVVEPRRPFAQPARVLFFFGFPDLTDRNALQAALVAIEKIDQRAYSDNRREHQGQDADAVNHCESAYWHGSESQTGNDHAQTGKVRFENRGQIGRASRRERVCKYV